VPVVLTGPNASTEMTYHAGLRTVGTLYWENMPGLKRAARIFAAADAAEAKREEAVRVMAVMTMAFTVAPAVGPILGGYLQAVFDWHAVFAVLAMLGAALLATANARLPETNRHRDPLATRPGRMASTYAGLLANPAFLAYVVPSTAMIGGMLTMHASLPFLLIGSLGVQPTAYGWLTLITVAAFFSGSFVTGRFGPRIGTERTIRISLVLLGLSAALYLGSALLVPLSIASVLVPMVAWVFALGLAIPALMASAMAPFPRTAGSASALLGCMQVAQRVERFPQCAPQHARGQRLHRPAACGGPRPPPAIHNDTVCKACAAGLHLQHW
jgi:predicted MFS family arabinose efflux permease